MIVINTRYADYDIHTERYPYTNTQEILANTAWWWEQPTRKRNTDKVSNYSLDTSSPNTVGHSLIYKLHNGEFNFLYYKNQLILYAGLRIDADKNAWLHRGASHPELGKLHIGAAMTILMPHQARMSLAMGCHSYNISFNEYNYKFFKYYRDKHYRKISLHVSGGELFMDAFQYKENVVVHNTNQFVGTLNLNLPNINEILDC